MDKKIPVKLEAIIEKINYHQNGFLAARILFNNEGLSKAIKRNWINMAGTYKEDIQPGAFINVEGNIVVDKQYGPQVQFTKITVDKNKGIDNNVNIVNELAALPSVDNALAKKIVSRFKSETFDVIMNTPEYLTGLGMNKSDALLIKKELQDLKNNKNGLVKLRDLGLSNTQIVKLINLTSGTDYTSVKTIPNDFLEDAYEEIKLNPYDLYKVNFIFKTCDKIAHALDFKADDINRIGRAIARTIKEEESNGHTFTELNELLQLTFKYLEKNNEYFQVPTLNNVEFVKALKTLDDDVVIVLEPELKSQIVYAEDTYHYQKIIEEGFELRKNYLKENKSNVTTIKNKLDKFLLAKGVTLNKEQYNAVLNANLDDSGVFVLLGGAGTGKTFTSDLIVSFYKHLYGNNRKIELLATTSKAAKELEKKSKLKTNTIHSFTKFYLPMHMLKMEDNVDFVLVDEVGMLDVQLLAYLIYILPPRTKILFMGDDNQLPSIAKGNVLKDLVEFLRRKYPHNLLELQEVMRQAQESGILAAATALRNKDDKPLDIHKEKEDLEVFWNQKEDFIKSKIKEVVELNNYDFNELEIIAPMKKGVTGVIALNNFVQELMDNHLSKNNIDRKKSISSKNYTFKIQDRIITNVKDGKKDKYELINGKLKLAREIGHTNSEMGVVYDIKDNELYIQFDDGHIAVFNHNDINHVDLAYCITIHKSQGAEWKTVICLINTPIMLNNNLIYTAITRAEKKLYIFANSQSFYANYKESQQDLRRSNLLKCL